MYSDAPVNVINRITKRNNTDYVLRDTNTDIPIKNRILSSSIYLNYLLNCCAFLIITVPTLVTETSATNIDHINTNDITNFISPGVI